MGASSAERPAAGLNSGNYASALLRVEAFEAQLRSTTEELAGATAEMESHEVEAAFAGAEIDPALREYVLLLRQKCDSQSRTLVLLKQRLEAVRVEEEKSAAAARAKLLNDRFIELTASQREAAAQAIAAVISAWESFRKIGAIQIELHGIATELKDGRTLPSPPPAFMRDQQHFDGWAEATCAHGYAECFDPSQIGRRIFESKKAMYRD